MLHGAELHGVDLPPCYAAPLVHIHQRFHNGVRAAIAAGGVFVAGGLVVTLKGQHKALRIEAVGGRGASAGGGCLVNHVLERGAAGPHSVGIYRENVAGIQCVAVLVSTAAGTNEFGLGGGDGDADGGGVSNAGLGGWSSGGQVVAAGPWSPASVRARAATLGR